ncbi:MAG: DUF3307 domain-containing protein [Desulfotomaculum sp.]|nr:DUF3307 domain-containing protein [Desulfotomaculum sp.]
MTPFAWLVLGHLAGDYLLQNSWMALNKKNSYLPLFSHCFVYTLTVYLFSLFFGGLSLLAVILIFIAHLFLDKTKFIDYWLKYVTQTDLFWLKVITDQVFHLLVLALILHFKL